jgi:hypothetical protein
MANLPDHSPEPGGSDAEVTPATNSLVRVWMLCGEGAVQSSADIGALRVIRTGSSAAGAPPISPGGLHRDAASVSVREMMRPVSVSTRMANFSLQPEASLGLEIRPWSGRLGLARRRL